MALKRHGGLYKSVQKTAFIDRHQNARSSLSHKVIEVILNVTVTARQ